MKLVILIFLSVFFLNKATADELKNWEWTKEEKQFLYNSCTKETLSHSVKLYNHQSQNCGCIVEELSKIMDYSFAMTERGNIALLDGIGTKCNSEYLNELE